MQNKNDKDLIDEFLKFLEDSPTPFHAVANMATQLDAAGFKRLQEQEQWNIQANQCYYVVRGDSSLIAFSNHGDPVSQGIRMVGAHTDSPCLKIKPQPERIQNGYFQLLAEVYGGVLLNPWFDRDLSLAGRITLETDTHSLVHLLIDFKNPIAFIPSLAIHLDREANSKRSINSQKHTIPVLFRADKDKIEFQTLLIQHIQTHHPEFKNSRVLGYELSLYDTQSPALLGLHQEFIASARLDNLLSCFVGLKATLEHERKLPTLLICNNHEEVGSQSSVGAKGPFLNDVLSRWIDGTRAARVSLNRSLFISADNAHGIHPNYNDRHDSNHGPLLNHGPTIKLNHNQSYATDHETSSVFQKICEAVQVPCQSFVSRNDMGCGTTIGPITSAEVGVKTLDIGVPQFAMHSIREVCGAQDIAYLFHALKEFYHTESLNVKAAI